MAKKKAAKNQTASSETAAARKLQLSDQSTGFYDRETGLKIVRDGIVEIDAKKRVGKLTLDAIRAGRLIEVSSAPAEKSESSEN
jgi:hypothetical protein